MSKKLRYACVQPDDTYYTWQVHLWLESLKLRGESDKAIVLIFIPNFREQNPKWEIRNTAPDAWTPCQQQTVIFMTLNTGKIMADNVDAVIEEARLNYLPKTVSYALVAYFLLALRSKRTKPKT